MGVRGWASMSIASAAVVLAVGVGIALGGCLQELAEADDADATFVFGDFNEPSGRDWTAEAFDADQRPTRGRRTTALLRRP